MTTKGSSHKEWLLQREIENQAFRRKLEIREAEKLNIDKRAENRRLFQRLHAERREAETEDRIVQAKNSAELRKAQYEQEAKLAQEMDRVRREEMKQAKLRQKLRESSIELKTLEAQLRGAYVSKELMAQLAEKEAAKMEEKMREKEAVEFLRALWKNEESVEAVREAEEYQRKLAYRAELQDQMIYSERQKQVAYEDFLREKRLLDDVVRRIHEEDQREFELKMMKMKKTKEEMDAFHQAREEWKQEEKQEMEKENKRIEEYLFKQDIQEQERMAELQAREERKAIITEKIAQQMYEIEYKKREEEDLMLQLAEEEQKEEQERQRQLELERQLRQRIETQQAYRDQMAARMRKLQQEAEEEAAYKQKLLQEFAENERLEQLTAEKRRLKMLEYRRSVTEMLEERRQRRAEEMKYLLHMQELELEEEKARKRLIEEERLRMLKEHAGKLIGYLPRGVLREDDLPHLGSEFVKKYGDDCENAAEES